MYLIIWVKYAISRVLRKISHGEIFFQKTLFFSICTITPRTIHTETSGYLHTYMLHYTWYLQVQSHSHYRVQKCISCVFWKYISRWDIFPFFLALWISFHQPSCECSRNFRLGPNICISLGYVFTSVKIFSFSSAKDEIVCFWKNISRWDIFHMYHQNGCCTITLRRICPETSGCALTYICSDTW